LHVISDVIFVTYKSMMPVSTCKVCTPPRCANIPVLLYVRPVPVFIKVWWWCVSTSPESGTVSLPLGCCCPCVFPKFTIFQYCVKLEDCSRCGASTHLLPVLSCLSLRVCVV